MFEFHQPVSADAMVKKRVLITLDAFLPGYKLGGPIRSVANLLGYLGDEFDFYVLTPDRDFGDADSYPDVAHDCWVEAYGAKVRYCSPEALRLRGLIGTLQETPHDILYLNSFFSPRLTIQLLFVRRLGLIPKRPLILAPRGEFSRGALALKSAKKHVWMAVGKVFHLFSNVLWQASTEYEAADIHAAMGRHARRVLVASNLSTPLPIIPPPHSPREPNAPLRVVFLSRLSKKKNLDFALDVLRDFDCPIEFMIYGPEEDAEYVTHCRNLARSLPSHIQVSWGGVVTPQGVPHVLARHDLFFFPTRGENFGHVIGESLGVGTPVLLSDTTPWRGLEALEIGYDLPLGDVDAFRRALATEARLTPKQALCRRRKVAEYARARQRGGEDVKANRALLLAAADCSANV